MAQSGRGSILSRPFSAGSFDFFVESSRSELVSLAEQLFRDLPGSGSSEDASVFAISPSAVASDGDLYDIDGPALGSVTGVSLSGAITLLVTGLSRATLDAEPERLHIHAAGAIRGEYAALLVAPSETGKTTTLAHLASNGWGFMSDEMISITPDDAHVRGYAKPLSIKPAGRSLVSEFRNLMLPPGVPDESAVLHLPLGATGAIAHDSATPHLIALLKRPPTTERPATSTSRRLHPVDAVVGLMGETMDAGRFGPTAVVELARLAARCHCHEVVLGDPHSAITEIEQLFSAGRATTLSVTELKPEGRIAQNVCSLLIGARVVIHQLPEGRIIALDEAASQIWLNLGAHPGAPHIDLTGPVVVGFVEHLVHLGLINAA